MLQARIGKPHARASSELNGDNSSTGGNYTTEIGILVIHGIGIQDKNFANGLIDKVNGRLKNNGVTPVAVAWEPAFWADLLTKNEEELWKDLSAQHNLSWVKVR